MLSEKSLKKIKEHPFSTYVKVFEKLNSVRVRVKGKKHNIPKCSQRAERIIITILLSLPSLYLMLTLKTKLRITIKK